MHRTGVKFHIPYFSDLKPESEIRNAESELRL